MGTLHVNGLPKAALVTLGCPMNQVDSERILGGLVSLGFDIVPEEEADVVVVNTCGFIEEARKESIDTILSVAELKKSGNLKALVVAGCLAERYRSELETELTEADAVVGLTERDRIPFVCLELLNREQIKNSPYSRVVTGPPHSAYLRIAEGCNNRCSYCAIPMIRGPLRSEPEATILSEAEELASIGTRELILIAQDITSYGTDLDNHTLPDLLHHLSEIEGIAWIRLLYANPARISDELIETMAELPNVLPYIDIPVQHISPTVLKRMGRFTPPERIYAIIQRLRERITDLVLRTSLMVGFPGESDDDFRELLGFIESVRFERLGGFMFSPEEGTRAALMEDSVPEAVASERFEILMETQARISQEFHDTLIGRELNMIVDSVGSQNGMVMGRTYMDAPEIDGNVQARGTVEEEAPFCHVLITGADTYDLTGEVLDNK